MLKRLTEPRIRLPSELVRGCIVPKFPIRLSYYFMVELLLLRTSYRRDSYFFGVLFFDKLFVVGVDDLTVVFSGDLARKGDFDTGADALIGDLLGLNGDFETTGRSGDLSFDCRDKFKGDFGLVTFIGDLVLAIGDLVGVALLSFHAVIGDLDRFSGDFDRIGDFEVSFLSGVRSVETFALVFASFMVFLKAVPKLLRYWELAFDLYLSCYRVDSPVRSGLFAVLDSALVVPTLATRYGDLLVRLSGDLLPRMGLLSLEP